MAVSFRSGKARARARAGLTLVEVVVALVVISIATALVGVALVPRTRGEDAEVTELLERSRSAAVRRAETMQLSISHSGAWTLARGRAGYELTAQGQVASRFPGPIVVLLSPFGTCALDIRSETLVRGVRLDPLTCGLVRDRAALKGATLHE